MPISDDFGRIELTRIIIRRDERQRRNLALDDQGMERSIAKHGVLEPVIITRDGVLVAGERRLEFSRKLGLEDIPFRYLDQLNDHELRIIELEENIKRRQLDWQDIVKSVRDIHDLYCQMDSTWTQAKTEAQICLNQGMISRYIKLAENMHLEGVRQAGSINEADNFLSRRTAREQGAAMIELLSPSPMTSQLREIYTNTPDALGSGTVHQEEMPKTSVPAIDSESVLNVSFGDWWPSYAGPKFNLIHCDFPYGGEEFAGPQMSKTAFQDGRLYDSSSTTFDELLTQLCEALPHIMSVSGHLMFWYRAQTWELSKLIVLFNKMCPSLDFHPMPLIWLKTDNSGVASDPRRGPRHIYEVCLLASRGGHQIVRVKADAYGAPTDRRIHPSCKPEPVLRHFMEMLVDDSTLLLDPTCGSGSALRAAESLGAKHVLGLEIDPEMTQLARQELRKSRLVAKGAQLISSTDIM